MNIEEIRERLNGIMLPSGRGDYETAKAKLDALNGELAAENQKVDWRAWNIYHYFRLIEIPTGKLLDQWTLGQIPRSVLSKPRS